jgi:peptide/nickel transport system substrate-binding protein
LLRPPDPLSTGGAGRITRTDRVVVGTLAVILLALAVVVGASSPAVVPSSSTAGAVSPSPTGSGDILHAYREGILGRPESISPLTARTRVDRQLVGLIFSGLVANGPNDTLVPGLATSWSSDRKGRTWTFHLRDATWHDGTPVTAADVVFTVHTLQDPGYTGPANGSWKDVTAIAVDPHTVRFQLATPLGGFLQAATQPIAPAHLLQDVPVDRLADDPFGQAPVGSGPYRLVSLDHDGAILEPTSASAPGPEIGSQLPSPVPTPTPEGNGSEPLPGIEFAFFDDAAALAQAYESGAVDGADGLTAADATRLAASPGSRLLRYPTTTLTAVFFNVRSGHTMFRDSRVRKALLQAIDRKTIASGPFGGGAVVADSLIPPTSWAFDPASSPVVAYSRGQAARGLKAAGWKQASGKWLMPGGKKPVAFEVIGPDATTNASTAGAVDEIARDWSALGLRVTDVGLDPTTLVGDRIEAGKFDVVVVDINIGLDPDLYPILASTQKRSGGLNVGGIQSPILDERLVAAREPGSMTKRLAAYKKLQQTLAAGLFVLPICFRDELVVVRDTLTGPAIRTLSDGSERFFDVLTWRLAIGR